MLDPSQEDIPARVLELTSGTGTDIAFECAGVNAVLDTMLDAVRPGGVVVNVSTWGAAATVDIQKLVLKELDLRGTIAYVPDHPAVITMVQEGNVDLKPFITGRIALDDLVEQGFDTLIKHKVAGAFEGHELSKRCLTALRCAPPRTPRRRPPRTAWPTGTW